MKKVILDTNLLLECVKNKVDIFDIKNIVDYDIYTLDKSIGELEDIVRKKRGKNRDNAKLALQIIKERVKVIKTKEGNVDDILVELSKEDIIATQDKDLKKRLKGGIIILRQGKYFVLDK